MIVVLAIISLIYMLHWCVHCLLHQPMTFMITYINAIEFNLILQYPSIFIIKEVFLSICRCCCFFKRRKRKTIQRHKWLWTRTDHGELHVFIHCLVIKVISVLTTCIFKDSLLETKMSYFHTSFCGCLTVIFFFFFLI